MDKQASNDHAGKRKNPLSRRGFLKSVGLVTAGVVAGPMLRDIVPTFHAQQVPGLSGVRTHAVKVGALIPASSVYRNVGRDQIDGLALGFRQFEGLNPNVIVETVTEEIGTAPRIAYEKVLKLVSDDKVDIIVGAVGTHALKGIGDLLVSSRTPLIINSVGEHVVTQAENSPFIFHNSLNYWQSNFATGVWASDNLGRRVFIAASFYDSGYDSVAAFTSGFKGRGGKTVGLQATHMIPHNDGMDSLMNAIEKADPDFVYGVYSGEEAVEFVRAYRRSGLLGRIPLAGSAFLVDENILPSHGMAADGVTSALTWSGDLQNPENREFTAAYKAWTGRAPSAFAVLGYDSARLISEALRPVEGDMSRSIQFMGALARVAFDGPRGHVSMSPQTQTTTSPIYLRKVVGSRNEVVAKLAPISETEDLGFTTSGLRSGWKNSYLVI